MKPSYKTGISFGLTSGIITTLGLMVGLNAGTGLKLAVMGGIITIAIADAFSDALGIHMSEESNNKNSHQKIWEVTLTTFLTKFIVALSFIIPLILFDLPLAMKVNIIWGFLLLGVFNYFLAKQRNESPIKTISEHLLIAVVVVILTNYVGKLIAIWFI